MILDSWAYDTNPGTYFHAIPSKTFSLECAKHDQDYWVAPDGCTSCYIILDLLEPSLVTTAATVILRNDRYNDPWARGTNEFKIEVGNSTTSWTFGVQSHLMDLVSQPNMDCDDYPFQKFHVGLVGRYVKFTALSYYGSIGALLKYIGIE